MELKHQRIAKFSKVSFEQYLKDWLENNPLIPEKEIKKIYDNIQLPKRASIGSAGYDFFAPYGIMLEPYQTIKILTGIRVQIQENWVLKCYPRSSLGFKYILQLNNTVGIIDSDYYNANNEGHIFVKMTNFSNEQKIVNIASNTAFMQGIFVEYGITIDDDVTTIRTGGIGSSDSK